MGTYDKDCDCFRSIDWGWSSVVSHQMLKRRSFLKNDDLILFVDFEGTFADLAEKLILCSGVSTDFALSFE